MIEFTTAAEVRTYLRMNNEDPDAGRVDQATTSANYLTGRHLFADDHDGAVLADLSTDEQAVVKTAAQIVARELIARPTFGVVDNDAVGVMFMSKDTLAGVRVMLSPIRSRLGNPAVDFGV